jgi:predicted enzyme related to lactoylglutathione lyase
MSMFKNVNVVYVYVKDWERAKKWYGDVLGWPVAFASDEAGWNEWGVDNATHVAINRASAGDPSRAGTGATITFTVDNVDKVQAELKKKGVKCDDILVIPGMVKIGTFYDPEGNRLQFVESAPPPTA